MDRATKFSVTTIVVLLGLGVLGNYLRFSEPPAAGRLGLDEVRLVDGGDYADEPIGADFLEVLRAKEVVFRTYGTEFPVWVFLGYFDRQKEGSQVHSPKHCYPGSGWAILDEEAAPAPWGEDEIMTLVVTDGIDRRLVVYWFQTPAKIVHDVVDLKIQLTKNAIVRAPQEVVFARVSTLIDERSGGAAGARRRLENFAVDVEREIAHLYRTRDETG